MGECKQSCLSVGALSSVSVAIAGPWVHLRTIVSLYSGQKWLAPDRLHHSVRTVRIEQCSCTTLGANQWPSLYTIHPLSMSRYLTCWYLLGYAILIILLTSSPIKVDFSQSNCWHCWDFAHQDVNVQCDDKAISVERETAHFYRTKPSLWLAYQLVAIERNRWVIGSYEKVELASCENR